MIYYYNLNNIDKWIIKFNGIGINEVILVLEVREIYFKRLKWLNLLVYCDFFGVWRYNNFNNYDFKKSML